MHKKMFPHRKTFGTLSAVVAALSLTFGGVAWAHSDHETLGRISEARDVGRQHEAVENVVMPDGRSQRLLFDGPIKNGRGVIVMFPGGAGEVGIKPSGNIQNDENFVVRTRTLWAQKGFGVVIVDAIDGKSLRGVRSTASYARDIATILAFVHSETGAPVWVMGTSQGSIAAMRAASESVQGELAGVVLTESVSVLGKSHETVFDSNPENVRIPALIVANQDDGCWVAPPGKAKEIAASMPHAPSTIMMVKGGEYASKNVCGSRSPHGYWGIEGKVVDQIDDWMGSIRVDGTE